MSKTGRDSSKRVKDTQATVDNDRRVVEKKMRLVVEGKDFEDAFSRDQFSGN